MSAILQIGQETLDAAELVARLRKYRLLPQFVQEFIVDQATADIACDPQKAMEVFCGKRGIFSEEQRQAWCQQQNHSPEEMLDAAIRERRLELFQEQTWGTQIESYFLERKAQLDQVTYSLIRTKDASLAQELYFRLNDDGASFAELASRYSEGQESKTGGVVGPVELSVPHPILSRMLTVSKPRQLWSPTQIGEWLVIARLEQFEPAKFDDVMRRRLLAEKFQAWLKQQIQTVSVNTIMPNAPDEAAGEAVLDERLLSAAAPNAVGPDETLSPQAMAG
ncbi:peptidylprolyl isomerase [cf. Phormidesmis sp. LEGE 11477]|uniref:peptidylprolyl isomerase n=1 Tax=cf. Phormidesmis sp. LEGE 11477 TaxID=1828680 RepID=UPI001D14D8DA|nr:peptidylprolyl isomerase [cf. Phormidesmis sp. LEGE 11477]